jgi:isopenicillin N synthase-like dioxygenase
VIVDEVEQVLSHLLSSTVRDPSGFFRAFKQLISNAKSVVALDADLGWTSYLTLSSMRASKRMNIQSNSLTVYINEFKPKGKEIEIYKNNRQLIGSLLQDIEQGRKIYFSSNSKRRIDSTYDAIKNEYPDNIFPSEMPEFATYTLEAYRTLEAAGVQMLRAIAIYLGLDENYFDSRVKFGNSILRPLHYFPIENPDLVPPDAVRAAAHGDINLITLLMGASAEGLQVLRRDGAWIPITALPEQVVVNVGDMLERLTNKKLKSTIHRVVNPPREKMGTSRYSIPFFMHPRAEMDLTCLPNCITPENPKQFTDISAGAFLNERLKEIGLKK